MRVQRQADEAKEVSDYGSIKENSRTDQCPESGLVQLYGSLRPTSQAQLIWTEKDDESYSV